MGQTTKQFKLWPTPFIAAVPQPRMVRGHQGHAPLTVTRTLRGETLEVRASLEPEARVRPRRPRRPRPAPAAMKAPVRPSAPSLGGYRDDPYE